MIPRVGRIIPPPEVLPTGSRYASPTGGGDGLTEATPTTLAAAITAATAGAVVSLAPGSYTGAGEVAKRLDIRPPAYHLSNSVAIAPIMYPGRGTLGSLTTDLYKATSLVAPSSGENWLSITPPTWAGGGSKMGVLYLHGAQGNETQPLATWPFSLGNIILAVVAAGYPVLSIFAGGDMWGNATAQARMDEARTYIQGAMGAKAGAIGLIGGSMGGANVLNWAKNNLASTACVVGLTPVTDITDIYVNNRAGLVPNINTGWGTWSEDNYGADFNPATYAAAGALAGLKYKAWYGASDTIVMPATVAAAVTAIGGTASGVEVAGNHTTALANIPPADVVAFLNANQS